MPAPPRSGAAGQTALPGAASGTSCAAPPLPDLKSIEEQQYAERDYEHHRGNGRCPYIIIFLEVRDDQERRDLRNIGQVAGNEDDRAIFAGAPGESEGEAGCK